MTDTLTPLILELLVWLAKNPRPYAEVMEAWRTSCPRLPVWEEASDRRLVALRFVEGLGLLVELTAYGRSVVEQRWSLTSPP
jgi:hypothetical protein